MKKLNRIRRQYKRFLRICRNLNRVYGRQIKACGICFLFLFILIVGGKTIGKSKEKDVYAAASQEQVTESPQASIPPGISGAVNGVREIKNDQDEVARIGTSCEEVIVGQRVGSVKAVTSMNASQALEEQVKVLSSQVDEKTAQSTIMSDNDYATLLSIVEAESGGEDLKGRILVANVILNRVASDRFPNSVYDVVWEVVGGMAQFSPTEDGRINTVEISDTTVKAVKSAIEGKDYSQGALFFVAKDQANQDNVKWFDSDLKHLFTHGVHTFYTYPDL